MAKYELNAAAVRYIEGLIEARQYVLDSDWGEVQPGADAENAYLARHSWDEYAAWHLGLTARANDGTKARYAFVGRRLPPDPPVGTDRLRLPCVGVAAQGRRARGTTTCSRRSTGRRID